jgi:hypothetical protein
MQEKGLATDQLNKREFNKLGFGPKVLAKIKNLSVRDQSSVYSNLIDENICCPYNCVTTTSKCLTQFSVGRRTR